MVAYNPPSSKSVVEIPKDLVDRYEAAGWTKVKASPEKPARTSSKK